MNLLVENHLNGKFYCSTERKIYKNIYLKNINEFGF